jgi:predicted Zn finger-like uncharacterized protein
LLELITMDICCPQCDTLYEIDARHLRGGAATLKCSQCDHVFRLQSEAALSQENQRRWMVKNTGSGDILYLSGFDQLHEWILQGKVDKSDQVSRTGKTWKCLEEIGEFRPIFQAVESISSISASHGVASRDESRAVTSPEGSGPSSAPQSKPAKSRPNQQPEKSQSNQQPANQRRKLETSPQFGAQGKSLAPVAGPGESSTSEPVQAPAEPSRPKAAPAPRSPQSKSGAQPESGAQSKSGSQPKVRLQTGAFTASSNAPNASSAASAAGDEEWSFGDQASLDEAENSGLVEQSSSVEVVEYDGGGRRWPVVVVVALLIVAGAGVGVYFLRPDLLETYLPQKAEADVVDIDQSDEGSVDDAPKAASVPPNELVQAALGQALASAAEANATQLGAAAEVARPKLYAVVDEATQAAKKAAEEPDADELLSSAERYLEEGDPRRARQKFHKVLELDRNNAEAITGLGWSLLALGNSGAASAQFRKALSYSPGSGNAYIGLGKAEREQGNHQAALKAYQNYLGRFPGGNKASIARYQADKLKQTLGQ